MLFERIREALQSSSTEAHLGGWKDGFGSTLGSPGPFLIYPFTWSKATSRYCTATVSAGGVLTLQEMLPAPHSQHHIHPGAMLNVSFFGKQTTLHQESS